MIIVTNLNALNIQGLQPSLLNNQLMCTKEFTDCSNKGGYDERDPCNHTCKEDHPLDLDLQNLSQKDELDQYIKLSAKDKQA